MGFFSPIQFDLDHFLHAIRADYISTPA